MKVVLVLLLIVVLRAHKVQYLSNFNASCINDAFAGDPVSLPIILHNPGDDKFRLPLTDTYHVQRYELKDTNYTVEPADLSDVEHDIVYKKEPPSSVFDFYRVTIEDYQLLEMKDFRIMLTNPSRYKFCINEIYADSEAIKRIEQKKLPFCLNPYNKYPFFFTLYITDHRPLIFRTSIYFIISVYDGNKLVDEKIWPREVIAKVTNNHLRIGPMEAKNCGRNYTTLVIPNPQPYHIKINFENEQETLEKSFWREVMIPSQKSFKMNVLSKEATMVITTWAPQMPDIKYAKLYMPIFCVKPLEIDYFNIGILNSDRSLVQVSIPVSNHAKQLIQIKVIQVLSSTGTVQIINLPEPVDKVLPGSLHAIVCRLMIHVPKEPTEKTTINIRIAYTLISNPKETLESKRTLSFLSFRNPLSMAGRRFIDVTKQPSEGVDQMLENVFPIKNNLNIPLLLVRVVFDEKVFKLKWLKDRREYIYSNQQKQEFALQYIGSPHLSISPLKYLVILEFNGNLFIPVEVVVYDHSLQCVLNNVATKCSEIGTIDYGYFRGNSTRFKQLVIRNWNPVQKELKFQIPEDTKETYGMNCTLNIFGPFPNYEAASRSLNNTLYYQIKGGHFIIIAFGLTPLPNARSGLVPFQFGTENESFTKNLKFKVENGTIALIPQVLRIKSGYEKSLQYLNLVSTYSEPYRIKTAIVNSSDITVFFNNHTEIFESQWIGLAISFNPFARHNITDQCCGHDFALTHFINSLYTLDSRRFTYMMVKIITNTELEANSTIIVDNKQPKLLPEDNISITLVESVKEGEHLFFTLKNTLSEPLKYSIILGPEYLHEDAKQYMTAVRRTRKNSENAMLCVHDALASKHNFSPQMVRNLFDLDSAPQEVTIEPLDNSEYYVGSQRINAKEDDELSSYVIKAVDAGARICYRASVPKYLKDLIETNVLNDVAEEYSTDTFLQFIQKQMEYLAKPIHFLTYDEFYDQFSSTDLGPLSRYCDKFVFPLFRFCHNLNFQVVPSHDNVLQRGAEVNITFKMVGPSRDIAEMLDKRSSFYFTILNNITKHESHHVSITLTQPKLAITDILAPYHPEDAHNSSDTHRSIIDDFSLKRVSKSFLQVDKAKERSHLAPNIFPLSFEDQNLQLEPSFVAERILRLTNQGAIDIEISHMGFEGNEHSCAYEGLSIEEKICSEGFRLGKGQSINVPALYQMPAHEFKGDGTGLMSFNWYLYNKNDYYYRLVVVVKAPPLKNSQRSYSNSLKCLVLNLASLVVLGSIIVSMKRESDLKANKSEKKVKVMRQQNYCSLGSALEKKSRRKFEPISEEILASVKLAQENKIKEYFNSSDESEITSRNQVEEEQQSGNQILNALKQEGNNNSVSEESSIDFIDMNAINRSTDNVEEDRGMSEGSEGSEGSGEASWQTDGDEVSNVNFEDYGWGQESEGKKESNDSDSYYNVFLPQNPLKKKQSNDPFHWMQDFSRGR